VEFLSAKEFIERMLKVDQYVTTVARTTKETVAPGRAHRARGHKTASPKIFYD